MNSIHKQLMPVLLIILSLSSIACNSGSTSNGTVITEKNDSSEIPTLPTVFEKLLGTWHNEEAGTFEQWTKNDKGAYRSVVYSIKGADTSWNEQADIYPENDKWIFENTVKGQNDGKSVKFVSSSLAENSVQFSNPAHDFPTDVNYTLADVNILHAFIIGPNNKGGKDTIPFSSKKVK